MDTRIHNGFTNYATWIVALYVDNEFSIYRRVSDEVRSERFKELLKIDKYEATFRIANMIFDWVTNSGFNSKCSVLNDLEHSMCELDDVNFTEIADNNIRAWVDNYKGIYV